MDDPQHKPTVLKPVAESGASSEVDRSLFGVT